MLSLDQVLLPGSVPRAIASLSTAVVIGLAVGSVRVKGVRLGVAAVLFSSLAFGQMGLTIDPTVLDYFRDFALVVFVYALGLQMGPGLVASLKAEGLRLNAVAVAILVLAALTTAGIAKLTHAPAAASGLYAGALDTTPALAAGEDAIRQKMPIETAREAVGKTDLAYSVAYPIGLIGPLAVLVVLRSVFRIDFEKERAQLDAADQSRRPPRATVDVRVTRPDAVGIAMRDKRFFQKQGVRLTRLQRDGHHSVPTANTIVALNDTYRAIGPQTDLDKLVDLLGERCVLDAVNWEGGIGRVEMAVTNRKVLGRSLRDLDLLNRHGVAFARICRAGVDIPAVAGTTLHFGDNVTVVGPESGLKPVEDELGNSLDALNQTPLIPIFLGLCFGVIAGGIPFVVPGLGTTVKLGLAGGPMLVAILLSRLGHIGSVVWYMPDTANRILRDFGMAVFLACVGLHAGHDFIGKMVHGGGLPLVGYGAVVTFVPTIVVALFARWVMRMNFITLSGVISGSMTSSPTLLFANDMTGSQSAAVAYAAVYPLSMVVPIIASQLLATTLL